jgi:predicted dehydrogenase
MVDAEHGLESFRQARDELEDLPLGAALLEVRDEIEDLRSSHRRRVERTSFGYNTRMADISVCFLGCGKINAGHVRILKRLRPRARVAVASRDVDRARAFARKVGAADSFGGYEDAIRSGYEVVVVGVPPRAHRALVEAALAAGKHILIEKPVFHGFDDLEALWPALRSHPATVMVAENLHFAPFFRRAKALLGRGDLGRPLLLDLTRLGRSSPTGWRADPNEMPLGALHEGGVHWIRRLMDLASAFESSETDHVIELFAMSPPAPVTTTPGEDTMVITARHRSGLVSRLLHTWAVPWRFWPFDSSKLLLENGALYFDGRGIYGRFYGTKGRRMLLPSVRDAGGSVAMWRDFVECVETGRAPQLTLEHVFADFAYMDAAYRSLRSGRPEAPRRATAPAEPGRRKGA